jgi:predicted regulator of Ras-like GTPase activity (Roadblock/LC7/MglB family)
MAGDEAGNAAQLDAIRMRVRVFAAEAGAQQVVLLDMSGHVLAAAGAARQDDVALGALLAGLFGSARALAALFGGADFRAFFQQGTEVSIYTLLIGDRWLLVTVFDRRSQVGMVRLLAHQTAAALADDLVRLALADLTAVRATIHSQAFRASFDDTLDRLFQDDPLTASEER